MLNIQARGNDTAGYITYFSLIAGDAVNASVEFEDIDLTDTDIKMTIGTSPSTELTIGNGGIVVDDAAAGQIRIVIDSSVTYGWKPCEFPFDLWLIPAAGVANNYLQGFFTIKRGQTVVP